MNQSCYESKGQCIEYVSVLTRLEHVARAPRYSDRETWRSVCGKNKRTKKSLSYYDKHSSKTDIRAAFAEEKDVSRANLQVCRVRYCAGWERRHGSWSRFAWSYYFASLLRKSMCRDKSSQYCIISGGLQNCWATHTHPHARAYTQKGRLTKSSAKQIFVVRDEIPK